MREMFPLPSKRLLPTAMGTSILVFFVLSGLVGWVGPVARARVEYVSGDKILDEHGSEVVWRGVGGCYLLNSPTDYLAGWRAYMPYLKNMGINTARLAFDFPWDPVTSEGIILNYTKMDEVINYLAQNGIRSILDNHSSGTLMLDANGTLNQQLARSWQDVASHYRNNVNVVAYELYNEPTHRSQDRTSMDIAQAYNELTSLVRQVDPSHIVIWQTPWYYIPIFEQIEQLMLPNVVYAIHKWWTNNTAEILQYGAEELSKIALDPLVCWHSKYNIPIWLGEFGGPKGGSSDQIFTGTDPHWRICQQLLYRCEEQAIGWNLWMGYTSITNIRPRIFQPLFPLQVNNTNPVRQTWIYPSRPDLIAFLVSENGLDSAADTMAALFHNGDFVVLNSQGRPAISVKIVLSRVINGTEQTVSNETITVANQNVMITNTDWTPVHPGDWNTRIYVQ